MALLATRAEVVFMSSRLVLLILKDLAVFVFRVFGENAECVFLQATVAAVQSHGGELVSGIASFAGVPVPFVESAVLDLSDRVS
jgi:hypothetical protein